MNVHDDAQSLDHTRVPSSSETIVELLRKDGVPIPPPPMQWTRAIPRPNEPFELCQGILEVTTPTGAHGGPGRVEFRWFPYQQVAFALSLDPAASVDPGEASFRLPHLTSATSSYIWGINRSFAPNGGHSTEAQGILLEPLRGGSLDSVERIVFALPNFTDISGAPIGEHVQGAFVIRLARHVMHSAELELQLEAVPDLRSVEKALEEEGGYAITHLGSLRQANGNWSTSVQVEDLLDDLSLFFSFVRGFRCSPTIADGLDSEGQVRWRSWSVAPQEPFKRVLSWFPRPYPDTLASSFPGFMALLARPRWREATRQAVHWYVSANTWAGGTPGAIVLTQAALERLATEVSLDGTIVPRVRLQGRGSSDRLRSLLSWAGISHAMPPELSELARAGQWRDAPHALTSVRDSIVHPDLTAAAVERPEVQAETWRLGLEYLELVLLKLCGHAGHYKSRVRPGQYLFDVHPVPWQSGSGPAPP